MKQRLLFILIVLLSLSKGFAQNYNMVTSGRFETCSGMFYDAGGPTGDYGNSLTQVVTFCPNFPQSSIQVSFREFNLQNNNDILYIYDGENINAPLLATLTGNEIPLTEVASGTNTSGCLTFRFISDGAVGAPGWAAQIECVTPCQVITARLNSSFPAVDANNIIRACVGEPITLNGGATFSRNAGSAVYSWNLDDGRTITGQNALFTYNQPGIYRVNLFVTDPSNCRNNNRINQVIQVAPRPAVASDLPDEICFGQLTEVEVSAAYERITRACAPPISGTTFLPDGNNNIYNTSVTVDCFANNQVITAGSQIRVCLNMEHSYAGDLTIRLISPNGVIVNIYDGRWDQDGGGTDFGHPSLVGIEPGTGETYCFDMDAAAVLSNNTVTNGMFTPGTYLPWISFDRFVGSPVNGVWTLQVHDQLASDNGYIFWWDIQFDDDILPAEYAFTPEFRGISVPNENGLVSIDGNKFSIRPNRAGLTCYPVTFIDDFGCTYTQEFCTNVLPEIQAGQPRDLEDCINPQGIAEFNLNDVLLDITNNPFLRVTFHGSLEDAEEGLLPLGNLQTRTMLDGPRVIFARVFNTQTECYTIKEFTINPLDCNLVLNPLADLSICQGDVNSFNLRQYDTYVYNNDLDYDVTYHLNDNDALLGINAIDNSIASNYGGTNGQSIFVRVTNIYNDEIFEVTSFKLWIHPKPAIIPLPTISSCEVLQSGLARFDLSPMIPVANGGANALEVTFYDNLSFAELGQIGTELPLQYDGPAGTLYVRVYNPNTKCYIVTELVLNIVPLPIVSQIAPLVLCDDNNDGRAVFNLEPTGILIAGNPLPQGVFITYHETLTDAELRQNAIVNINTYENITLNQQTIYVRVGYRNSSCSAIVPLVLQVNPTPAIITPTPITMCDNDNNGVENFDLTVKETELLNGLNRANYTITYHLTEAGAHAETNLITNPRVFSNNTAGTVFVRVEDNVSGCYKVVRLLLEIQSGPIIPNVVPTYVKCDLNSDGFETFDLRSRISSIVGVQQGLLVTFHYTRNDAQQGINPLPNTYQNVSPNVQTLFVRVYNDSKGCFSVTTMDIKVVPNPVVSIPTTPFPVCNLGGTGGFGTIDLTSYVNPLLVGTGFVATYFETQYDAENSISPLPRPFAYNNLQSTNPVVWVRIVNLEGGCYSVYPIRFQLVAAPNMPLTLPNVTACDAFGDTQDGITIFDLTVQNDLILGANSGNLSGFVIRYYETEANALAGINWIADPTQFRNTTSPQTIWVSVENQANPGGCKRYRSFEINSYLPVMLTQPTAISKCETSLPNNGSEVFDLTIRESEILGGLQVFEASFSYYPTERDRELGTNRIQDPTRFGTFWANQIVYVKVTSENGCTSYTTLTLRVLPLPEINQTPTPIEICEGEAGTGFGNFNLRLAEEQLSNEIAGLFYEYYNNYDGAVVSDPDSIIGTPGNYFASTGIVYVKIYNTPSNIADRCSVIVPLQIMVNAIPNIGPITPLFVCLDDAPETYTFNLRDKDNEVLAGQDRNNHVVRYFASRNDALANENPIPYIYRNVEPVEQEIFVRIENTLTGCFNVDSFIIRVEEKVYAFAPTSTSFCDIDFVNDGVSPIDLTVMDNEIISVQAVENLAVRYYTSNGALIANPRNYTARHGEEIIALVYSQDAGVLCTAMVTFNVYLKQGPEIKAIPNGVICYDFRERDKVLNGYFMDSGLPNTSDYAFEWILNGNVVGTTNSHEAVLPGNYTIRVTYLPTGCTNSRTIQVTRVASITIDEILFSESFEERMVVEVKAVTENGFVLEYKMDEGPWQDSPIFDNVTPGEHLITVRVKNEAYCPAQEVIQVMSHPLYFTPNGDGFNDTWNITALKYQPEAQVHIFDRYGKLIKTISPSGPGWDGTFNGKEMPSTDYWFKATYIDPTTGNEKESTGHFSLKR